MSIIIFLVQLAILAILLVLFSGVEKEFTTAIDGGFSEYATNHPTRSLLTVTIWGLLVLTLSIMAGFLEPIERIALFNQRKLGVLEHDLWFDAFMAAPQRNGFSRCYVRAWHKDGACYAGWLETFELTSEDEKHRFFWLLEAQRWKTHDEANAGEPGEFIQGVVLQSNDIESIDIWWGDGPGSSTYRDDL